MSTSNSSFKRAFTRRGGGEEEGKARGRTFDERKRRTLEQWQRRRGKERMGVESRTHQKPSSSLVFDKNTEWAQVACRASDPGRNIASQSVETKLRERKSRRGNREHDHGWDERDFRVALRNLSARRERWDLIQRVDYSRAARKVTREKRPRADTGGAVVFTADEKSSDGTRSGRVTSGLNGKSGKVRKRMQQR